MLEGGSIIERVRRSPFASSVLRACIPLIISWKFLGEPPKIYQQSELRKKNREKVRTKKVKRKRLRALDVWTEIETAEKMKHARKDLGNPRNIWVQEKKKGDLLTTSRKQSPPRTRPAIRKATRAHKLPHKREFVQQTRSFPARGA